MDVSFMSEFDISETVGEENGNQSRDQGSRLTGNSEAGCKGDSVFIEKNNSNILGPGPVNLTDVNFDKRASSFTCL